MRETSLTSNRNPLVRMEEDTHDRQTNLTQIAAAQYTAERKDLYCYKPTAVLMTRLNEQQ